MDFFSAVEAKEGNRGRKEGETEKEKELGHFYYLTEILLCLILVEQGGRREGRDPQWSSPRNQGGLGPSVGSSRCTRCCVLLSRRFQPSLQAHALLRVDQGSPSLPR